jgi:hypothetical protein
LIADSIQFPIKGCHLQLEGWRDGLWHHDTTAVGTEMDVMSAVETGFAKRPWLHEIAG